MIGRGVRLLLRSPAGLPKGALPLWTSRPSPGAGVQGVKPSPAPLSEGSGLLSASRVRCAAILARSVLAFGCAPRAASDGALDPDSSRAEVSLGDRLPADRGRRRPALSPLP